MKLENKYIKIILISLLQGERSLIKIAKDNKIYVYPALCNARKELEEEGFITARKNKRSVYIKLTEKGTKVAKKLKELEEIINN